MTEYHVQELAGSHITNLTDAQIMAEELAEVAKTEYGVYILVSTYCPSKKRE